MVSESLTIGTKKRGLLRVLLLRYDSLSTDSKRRILLWLFLSSPNSRFGRVLPIAVQYANVRYQKLGLEIL